MDCLTLNRYYEQNVKMTRDDTSRAVNEVIPIVHEILKYVNARDKRFKIQPQNVGSYYNNLKVSRADEFDFSVVLDVGKLVWISDNKQRFYGYNDLDHNPVARNRMAPPSPPPAKGFTGGQVVVTRRALPTPPPGKYFTRIGDLKDTWIQAGLNSGQRELTIDDDIVPIKVKRYFKSLVGEAVNQPKFEGIVSASRLSDSPATKLTIKIPNLEYDINVDLCPLIEAGLPIKPEFGWPRPNSRKWISFEKINKIQSIGCNEIAKDPFYWTLSFAACEKELLNNIDVNGTCRKKVLLIVKKLRDDIWSPKHIKQELTSYILMNVFFHECDNYHDDAEWQQHMLAQRVHSIVHALYRYLQRENLPQYFNDKVNLLASKDKAALTVIKDRVEEYLNQPSTYLEQYVA